MRDILILECPHCSNILYELEESGPFVVAGMCAYCKTLLLFNPKKSILEEMNQPSKVE